MLVPFTLRCRAAALQFSGCSTVPKKQRACGRRLPSSFRCRRCPVLGGCDSGACRCVARLAVRAGGVRFSPCFCRNVCRVCGSLYPSIRTCCIRCPRIASVLSAWPLPLSHPLSSAPVRIASMVARMALVRIASVLPAFVSDPQAFPDRLFFSRAAAGYGHLLDAVLDRKRTRLNSSHSV